MTSVQFNRGQETVDVAALTLIKDGKYEDEEQFTITLTGMGQNRICEPSTATVVILDSDRKGKFLFYFK